MTRGFTKISDSGRDCLYVQVREVKWEKCTESLRRAAGWGLAPESMISAFCCVYKLMKHLCILSVTQSQQELRFLVVIARTELKAMLRDFLPIKIATHSLQRNLHLRTVITLLLEAPGTHSFAV